MNTGSTYVHVTADAQALATPGVLRRIILNGLTLEFDATLVADLTVVVD